MVDLYVYFLDECTKLSQIWEDVGLHMTYWYTLDFRYIALFQNTSDSDGDWVKNRGKFQDFFIPAKVSGGMGEIGVKFSLGPNIIYTLIGESHSTGKKDQ